MMSIAVKASVSPEIGKGSFDLRVLYKYTGSAQNPDYSKCPKSERSDFGIFRNRSVVELFGFWFDFFH